MEVVVYVDLFFIINFSMDFLCLFLTTKILSRKFNLIRSLLAALFGGIYAVISLFLPFGGLLSLTIDILAALILCAIAFFEKKEYRRLPVLSLVYVAVSMTLGGFMTALFNLFNKTKIFEALKLSDGDGLSVWLFAALALISAIITLVSGNTFKRKMSIREATVEITYRKRTIRLSAMTDSGNLLCEPISGKPCIITDIKALSRILPEKVICSALSPNTSELLTGLDTEDKKRVVMLPTVTVDGKGLLIGLRADKIIISDGKRNYQADAIIALSSLGDTADGKSALIPASLMAG